jgi:hypothetical protein
MAQQPTRSRRRRGKPRKKRTLGFVDAVLEMLESTAGKVMFGAGAVLLGKAEWRRLAGDSGPGAEGVHASRAPRAPRNGMRKEPPRPEVVQLVRGADGVYRPET